MRAVRSSSTWRCACGIFDRRTEFTHCRASTLRSRHAQLAPVLRRYCNRKIAKPSASVELLHLHAPKHLVSPAKTASHSANARFVRALCACRAGAMSLGIISLMFDPDAIQGYLTMGMFRHVIQGTLGYLGYEVQRPSWRSMCLT